MRILTFRDQFMLVFIDTDTLVHILNVAYQPMLIPIGEN